MFLKKTVVLSGKGVRGEKAVLSIEKVEEGFEGSLKLYNYESEPMGILSLGFLPENGKVSKCGLTKKGPMTYRFSLQENLPLNTFSCALIQIDKGKAVPILLGTHNSTNSQSLEERLAFSSELLQETPTIQTVQESLDSHNISYENQEDIEKEIDEEVAKTACSIPCTSCPYRKSFFDDDNCTNNNAESYIQKEAKPNCETVYRPKRQEELAATTAYGLNSIPTNQEQPTKPPETEDVNFYQQIQEELNELFDSYPRESILERIIPQSKWVRVNLDNEEEHYVVGTIEENGKLKYICYGIPGMFSGKPPKQIEKFAQWLPLDASKPNDLGYWMTYQEARSGESIKIVI